MKCLWKYLDSISIVCLIIALDSAEGLKFGEKGVCKLNNGGRNTTRKIVDRPVCCPDYIYKNNVCEPQCKFGCERGTCIGPNVCQCERPLVLSSEKNRCIEPRCEPACVNAVCENIDLCTCHADHVAVNRTHCAPKCRDGYENDPADLTCRPHCSRPCTKGSCTAPETCSCEVGYQLSAEDNYTCNLPCVSKCVSDGCTAPKLVRGVCSCDDGYKLENDSCLPTVIIYCNSCNGSCLDDNCHCIDGKNCFFDPLEPAEPAEVSTPKMAGLELTWFVAGAVGIVLVVAIGVVMYRIWRNRKLKQDNFCDNGQYDRSVVYTVPNTLIQRRVNAEEDRSNDEEETLEL